MREIGSRVIVRPRRHHVLMATRLRRSHARDTPGGVCSGIDAGAVGSAVRVRRAVPRCTRPQRGTAALAPPGIDAGAAGSTATRRAVAGTGTGAEGQAAFGAAPNIEADAAGSAGAGARACPRRTGPRWFLCQDAHAVLTRPVRPVRAGLVVQLFVGLAPAVFALLTGCTGLLPGARLRQVEETERAGEERAERRAPGADRADGLGKRIEPMLTHESLLSGARATTAPRAEEWGAGQMSRSGR